MAGRLAIAEVVCRMEEGAMSNLLCSAGLERIEVYRSRGNCSWLGLLELPRLGRIDDHSCWKDTRRDGLDGS